MFRIREIGALTVLLLTSFIAAAPASADNVDPVNCPQAMVNIGGEYCIDMYEYPNMEGEYSKNGVSFQQAETFCRKVGKRLCSTLEWTKACTGPEGYRYPYGENYEKGVCSDLYAPQGQGHYTSGDMSECVNGYGLFDMSGNLKEWTADSYNPGRPGGLKGGDAFSSPVEMACSAPAEPGTRGDSYYTGFRCCSDVITEPVARSEYKGSYMRGAAPPLTHNPVSMYDSQFTQTVEYVDIDNIVGNKDDGDYVSSNGVSLTASYQFSQGRLDFTRIEYKVQGEYNGSYQSEHIGANVLHASLLLPLSIDFLGWSGDVTAGVRRFDDNTIGQMSEYYMTKEYINGYWTILPSVNYIDNSEFGYDAGLALDLRYQVNPRVDLFAKYNSNDFYKHMINDFIVPYTDNASTMSCSNCKRNSGTVGMNYTLPGTRSKLYLMYYDIDDLKIPMAGTIINF